MNKKLGSTLLGLGLLAMAGCDDFGDAIVFPAEGDVFYAVSTSSDEASAMRYGLHKANETCQQQGKSYVVVSQESRYRGMNRDVKKMAQASADTAFFNGGPHVSTQKLSSYDDYKVTTVFRCQK